MLTKILKLLTVATLLLCYKWIIDTSSTPSYISFIVSLISFLSLEFKDGFSKPNHHDINLYEKFLIDLPSSGDISYIKNLDMAGAIDTRWLQQLYKFLNDWNNAEHKFINKRLENKRKELWDSIDRFFQTYGTYTFPIVNDFQQVPVEWINEKPKKYWEIVDELNSSAQSIYDSHQALIHSCTKKLKK